MAPKLKLSRILHAGYLFESGGQRIAFDPIFESPFSGNCFAFPEVSFDLEGIRGQKFDAVFISHYHDDHCSFESLDLLDRATPVYIFCIHPEMFELLGELGFHSVQALRLNSTVQVGDFKITPRRALDEDVDSIFHIEAGGLNILNVVDSWIDPEVFAEIKRIEWDLILWPFQTMREMEVLAPTRTPFAEPEIPQELIDQLKELKPRRLVPSACQFRMEEWSWYNRAFFPVSYAFFAQEIKRILPEPEVLRLDPGESILLTRDSMERADRLPWIIPKYDQVADYDYDPTLRVPSTAEICRNLNALTDSQMDRVIRYCESELKEKILDQDGGYFNKTRRWRLSIFDHKGQPLHFHFEVAGGRIKPITAPLEVEWLTEIPAVKLYAALEHGESLTSIYIRVNAAVFTKETEAELAASEVLEDPLIRSLYDGAFALFQRAQLVKMYPSRQRLPKGDSPN